jgi:hypothetical protein
MGVVYPIAVDNDFAVWRAVGNQAWPALYFVDAEGQVRHHHFGEEDYVNSELVIQQLLEEAGPRGFPRISSRLSRRALSWPQTGRPCGPRRPTSAMRGGPVSLLPAE